MKIQNRSAKLWIILGLLGLILFATQLVVGPFGGPLVGMFSDAGVIFLLVGLYLESKGKKKDVSKGFIPILAVVIIGIISIAGGTTAIILTKKAPVAEPEAPGTAFKETFEVKDTKTDVEPIKKTVSKPIPEEEKVITTEDKPEIEEKKIVPEPTSPPKVHPGIAYIDAFLSNPTIESLKAFCVAAKSMEGHTEEKVFNADRTGYEMKKKSLYQEAGASCSLALGEMPGSENFAWTYYSESYLLPLTDSGDSNDLRKKKIEYNNLIAEIPPYKLFAYDKSLAGVGINVNTPREMVEGMLSTSIYSSLTKFKMYIKSSIIVPEKKLIEIRNKIAL